MEDDHAPVCPSRQQHKQYYIPKDDFPLHYAPLIMLLTYFYPLAKVQILWQKSICSQPSRWYLSVRRICNFSVLDGRINFMWIYSYLPFDLRSAPFFNQLANALEWILCNNYNLSG